MLTSAEIRASFLEFFRQRGHTIVPSSSLLPDAPNLLFTNAGMNQFVPYFLGDRPAPYPRAADTQKCIRAGGKHNDLEDVGFDTYHHTFFEMLGNWSFGDYFKQESLRWGWELVTEVWKFPKERLYATVYSPSAGDPSSFDDEAYQIWAELFRAAGLDPAVHVVRGNRKDNFWMMGETGPCGPCSEIHVDLTPAGDTKGALVNTGSPLCIEIWNHVFIQFNATPDGAFEPLAQRHVDTGLGFERVAGILATTKNFTDFSRPPSNYDADIFQELFATLEARTGQKYTGRIPEGRENLSADEVRDTAFRVLADHARTLSCAIADGILPGNEGRNYVLRRILRRGVLWGRRVGLTQGAISSLVDAVVTQLGPVFPELVARRDTVVRVIQSEEAAFERTLDRGLQLFEKLVADGRKTLSGEDVFTLYDTYGFPVDLTELVARERGVTLDLAGFETAMEAQRDRARAAQKRTVITVASASDESTSTRFVGFDDGHLTGFATTLRSVARSGDRTYLRTLASPFYGELGGQVGDTGTAVIGGHEFVLGAAQRDGGDILHPLAESLSEGDFEALRQRAGHAVVLSVDGTRRAAIERHHTATHVLHWALRTVLGDHVRQAGSLVEPDRLRFDFAHFEALTSEQVVTIERLANERLLRNEPVRWFETEFDRKPANCLAFFGEKYGATVRVVDVGGWSVELCGGTHVTATGEIGLIKVVGESAIAAGVRRLEAVAGESALRLFQQQAGLVSGLALRLSVPSNGLADRLEQVLEHSQSLDRELRRLRQREAARLAIDLASQARHAGAIAVVAAVIEAQDAEDLKQLGPQILKQLGDGVVVLGAALGSDKATVAAFASPAAIAAGHAAGAIVKQLTTALEGKGGGKPDFAMGGGKRVDLLAHTLENWATQVTGG